MRPGTLCLDLDVLLHGFVRRPRTMLLGLSSLTGPLVCEFEHIGLGNIGHVEHGLSELGIEDLSAGLFSLDLLPTLQGLPHRLNRSGLEYLALSKRTDHALTTRADGSGKASLRHVFLDEPFGHGLSIGVVRIGIQADLDGLHLFHPDVRNHGQGLLGHGHKPCL